MRSDLPDHPLGMLQLHSYSLTTPYTSPAFPGGASLHFSGPASPARRFACFSSLLRLLSIVVLTRLAPEVRPVFCCV